MRPDKDLPHITLEILPSVREQSFYVVYAKEDTQDSPEKLIRSVTSTSRMTTSWWGDKKLSFPTHSPRR